MKRRFKLCETAFHFFGAARSLMQAVWESLHVREQAWASVRRATGAHPSLADTAKTAPGHAARGQEQWAVLSGLAPLLLADGGLVGYRAASHGGVDEDAVLGMRIRSCVGATR